MISHKIGISEKLIFYMEKFQKLIQEADLEVHLLKKSNFSQRSLQ
jgi:hypothetical protein